MRRHVAVLLAAMLAATGITGWASPAHAGDADDQANLSAAFYNVTPYTMRLVGYDSTGGFTQAPPKTIAPGDAGVYVMHGTNNSSGGICLGTWWNDYHGWLTYRVDVLGGPPEYLTMAINGRRSYSLLGCGDNAGAGNNYPSLTLYNTTAAPVYPWNPGSGLPPGQRTAKPQLTNTYNTPQLFDQTIGVQGNWTVDANSAIGSGLDEMLNKVCAEGTKLDCSFTQTGDVVWGPGAAVPRDPYVNCTPSRTYSSLAYKATREASLSVGGEVTLATEAELFEVIGTKVSVSLEAEHEWTETESIEREVKVYVEPDEIGTVFVAPNIATVTGTMRLRLGGSTFTVLNFRQTRTGVTKGLEDPAYDVSAEVRPATPIELHKFCGRPLPRTDRGDGARAGQRLVPGRGVGSLVVGRERSSTTLGTPLFRSPRANSNRRANDCVVLDHRCSMVAGRGGSWTYADASVVFDAERRVSALFYTGPARTAAGIGVGSGMAALRRAYPGISCDSSLRARNCSLPTAKDPDVRTTFHLSKERNRLVVDKVMIYRSDARTGRSLR